MIIRPAPGVQVRDPVSKLHIPDSGIEIPDTDTYWARRLRSGDVVEVKPAVLETPQVQPTEAPKAAVDEE